MAQTIVRLCKCANLFQDKTYGRNMRLMNVLGKGGDEKAKARCTCCGAVVGG